MSMNKKAKKNLILASVISVLVVGFAVGLWFFVQYQSDRKTVEVIPVSDPSVSTTYWGDTASSSGIAASNSLQEVYPTADKTVTDIYVTEGQQVAVGDPLIQYDKTKMELDVEAKDIAVKQAEIELDDAEDHLKKLQNTKPTSTPRPTKVPTVTPRPTTKPSATATPIPATPEPSPTVKPADVTLYRRLDLDSKPYSGDGSAENPYRFLCTEDCIVTREFLLLLLGESDQVSPVPEEGALQTPFAAVFEVREGDSNYGELLYSFSLDGVTLSQEEENSQALEGSTTLETLEQVFEATTKKATATPKPTPSTNYNEMGYTKQELNDLISEQRQKIKDLQLKVDQAKLDLKKAKIALENSTVRSTVDGVVRTLTDEETATANSKPFLVVSGDGQFVIKGSISESLLTSVQVGDMVTAMSYDNGMSYSAVITSISDFPLDSNSGSYYGNGNPNSSQYEFTAAVDNPEGLTNGTYLDITLNIQGQASADAIYLWKPYIREDEGGSYVMKAGIDNRLYKQYLELGTSIYSGEYFEVKSGLTMEDYIAFPYGTDTKEGVRVVVQGTEDPPIPEENAGMESTASTEEGTGESLSQEASSTDGATATVEMEGGVILG